MVPNQPHEYLKLVGGEDPAKIRRSEAKRHEDLETRWKSRQPVLMALSGQAMGTVFIIDESEMIIGREPRCGVFIEGDGVSRHHARLEQDRDKNVTLVDLSSKNGTFVNGSRVGTHLLRDGDKIKTGKAAVFRFGYHDSADDAQRYAQYERSVRDELTGIHNKVYFEARLREEFSHATRHYESLSLLIVDIDDFSSFNEKHGQATGNDALRKVSDVMSRQL